MFSSLKIGKRLAISIILMLLALIAIMLPIMLNQLNGINQSAEKRQLEGLQNSLQGRISASTSDSLMVIDAVINADGVAKAFAENNRPELQRLTLPIFDSLKKKYNIQQFQFHKPPATSFLRVHKLDKYGDDLSSFRHTVVRTNERKMPTHGLESGVAGIGLRGVAPVFYNGQHIGSAEVGLSFGQDFFDSFTAEYNALSALHIPAPPEIDIATKKPIASNNNKFITFGSTVPKATTLSQAEFERVMKGEHISKNVTLEGKSYAMLASPVTDFTNQTLGVSEILIDRSGFVKAYQNTLMNIVAVGIGALLLGLLLAWLISRSITQPIEALTEQADNISRGQFDQEITGVERKDEVGALARSVSRMAVSIKLAMEKLRKS